jgi:uncharacterized OB-fold protein
MTSEVTEARTPILRSFLPPERPGVPLGTRKQERPRVPLEGSVEAYTVCRSAMPPLEMKHLLPLIT